MDMPIAAEVSCADGPCGQVTSLIIDPTDEQVTHVVVRQKGSGSTERMVPLRLVRDTTPVKISLSCTGDALEACQKFAEDDYTWVYLPFFRSTPGYYSGWPSSADPAGTPTQKRHDHVPMGELAIQRDAWVEATDGRIGQLDEFQISPEDGRITGLLVREGKHGEPKMMAIPVSAIELIQENTIYLNLDKETARSHSARPSTRPHPPAQ